MHADLSRFSAARIANPDHAKAGLLFAVLDAYHVAFLADVIDSRDPASGAGDVYGSRRT